MTATSKPVTEEVLIVSPSAIAIGPFQPRRVFLKEAQDELVISVREKGIIQPLLVRPMPVTHKGCEGIPWELVCGERRLCAATIAECRVPVIVKELTDEQVREIQLVENLQRADLSPIDEADGFERLQAIQKLSVKEIAAKVGKNESYIYLRLKLVALGKAGRKAMADGSVGFQIGLLIARIPDEAQQAKALKEITSHNNYDGPRGMTLRRATEHIQRSYMLRLREAPWKLDDAKLLPEAGSCTACPKNTAKDRTLFGDVPADEALCTDGACYERKLDALWDVQREHAETAGLAILDDAEAKRMFPYQSERLNYQGAWIGYDEQNYDDPKQRTWRELLKKSALKPSAVRTPRGGVLYVIRKTDAVKALKECGHKFADDMAAFQGGPSNKSADSSRRKTLVGKKTALVALGAVAEKIEADGFPSESRTPTPALAFWKFIAEMTIKTARGSSYQTVAKRRSLQNPKGGRTYDNIGGVLIRHMRQLSSVKDVVALIAEVLCVPYDAYSSYSGYSENLKMACAHFGIDLKGLEKQVASEYGKRAKKPKAQKVSREDRIDAAIAKKRLEEMEDAKK